MALSLHYQTKEEFAAKARARYLSSSGLETLRLAQLIVGWIDGGDLTEAQISAAFNFANHGQFVSFVAKLNGHKSIYKSVQAAAGE